MISPIYQQKDDPPTQASRLYDYYQQVLLAEQARKNPVQVQQTPEAKNGPNDHEESSSLDSKERQTNDMWQTSGAATPPKDKGVYSVDEITARIPKKNRAASDKSKASSDTAASEIDDRAEQEKIRKLQERDAEVRHSEVMHKTILGPYAGNIHYISQIGPDGKPYVVSGTIDVDAADEPTPAQTDAKTRLVKIAALAGSDSEKTDTAVAAVAVRLALKTAAKATTDDTSSTDKTSRASGG